MMNVNLVPVIELLCDEHSITITGLEKELDFARGSIRRWNTNMPSIEKVIKISDYFHVSFDFLLGLTTNKHRLSESELQNKVDILTSENDKLKNKLEIISKITLS